MRSFGKANGGGQRAAKRTAAPLLAVISTLTNSRSATLVDISESGARLRGSGLPQLGQSLDLIVENLRAFATVVWSTGDECGVAFDEPFTTFELAGLRQNAGLASLSKLSVDERLAVDQWILGVSR